MHTPSYTHLVEVQDLSPVVGTPHTAWPLPLGVNPDAEVLGLEVQHFLVPTAWEDDGKTSMWTLQQCWSTVCARTESISPSFVLHVLDLFVLSTLSCVPLPSNPLLSCSICSLVLVDPMSLCMICTLWCVGRRGGPRSSSDNGHLIWIELQKVNPDFPVHGWRDGLFKDAILNLCSSRCLATKQVESQGLEQLGSSSPACSMYYFRGEGADLLNAPMSLMMGRRHQGMGGWRATAFGPYQYRQCVSIDCCKFAEPKKIDLGETVSHETFLEILATSLPKNALPEDILAVLKRTNVIVLVSKAAYVRPASVDEVDVKVVRYIMGSRL
eukprot:3970198-Amphidinium_carterae.1